MTEYTAFCNNANERISIANCVKIIQYLRNIFFKNYFGIDIEEKIIIGKMNQLLEDEIRKALYIYKSEEDAHRIVVDFNEKLKDIAEYIRIDVENFYESDPACLDHNEVILCYPGLFAIMVYRISNALYRLEVPYIPRIMSEYAHSVTGIDIHPGATIGKKFFIDHGTGIVIGETAIIGENVKMYQGVTLGAISLKDGHKLKGIRRHPKIEDNVIIYSNVSILGGDTIIGKNSVIGCNAFITKSVGPNMTIKSADVSNN